MLKNTPMRDINNNKKRKIIYIAIGGVCVLAIIFAIIIQSMKLSTPKPKVEKKPPIEVKEFSSIFDNKINKQDSSIGQTNKIKEDKELVYTAYEYTEKLDGKYDINVKIPSINIDSEESETINKEISDIFKAKAQSIMSNENSKNIIYTVEYSAYINTNILSVVIKSNLKEGQNAQRVIVKSYTYNITSGELIDINELLSIKKVDEIEVKKSIQKVVSENAKQSESLKNLGYKVYERNLNDEMYNVENIKNFFYGPDGVLYIIFAYGNNNFTAELDVITIQ